MLNQVFFSVASCIVRWTFSEVKNKGLLGLSYDITGRRGWAWTKEGPSPVCLQFFNLEMCLQRIYLGGLSLFSWVGWLLTLCMQKYLPGGWPALGFSLFSFLLFFLLVVRIERERKSVLSLFLLFAFVFRIWLFKKKNVWVYLNLNC